MSRYIFIIFALMVLSISLPAQTKQKRKTSHPAKNTILFEVLKNLADKNVCGAEADSSEVYTGTVLRLSFAEDELRLNGFVLVMSGDKRMFINLDEEHISGVAASASSDLSDWLIKGRKIKVSVYRCRRILYAHRIEGL